MVRWLTGPSGQGQLLNPREWGRQAVVAGRVPLPRPTVNMRKLLLLIQGLELEAVALWYNILGGREKGGRVSA